MPRQILLRHAKAEPHGPNDHSRVLAERGRADAAAVRSVLAELAPALAVVSTAARTRETWSLADPGGVPVVLDDRVYDASVADLREVLGELTVASAVLVGHNPGVEQLAYALDPTDQTVKGMRTCGMAVFETSAWDLADARLTDWR